MIIAAFSKWKSMILPCQSYLTRSASKRKIRTRLNFSIQPCGYYQKSRCAALPTGLQKKMADIKGAFSTMRAQVYDDTPPLYDQDKYDQFYSTKDYDDKTLTQCDSCTCDEHDQHAHNAESMYHKEDLHICHDDYIENEIPLPPPLPEPKYSFHRRIMPSSLIQFSSPDGRRLFQESLSSGKGNAFFPLSEQFLNQSDPAYCGVTTLIMILNAIGIDPNVRWKGGWRWYGSEEMILDSCCINQERVRRAGILMEEFHSLARCQGLRVNLKRPFPFSHDANIYDTKTTECCGLKEFREDIIQSVQNPPLYTYEQKEIEDDVSTEGNFMVVSFSRSELGQTGDGHFSPVAAYSEETDRCLVLDVARFKYPPYWVSVEDLYESMRPADPVTRRSRGWFMMHPPKIIKNDSSGSSFKGTKTVNEAKRPAEVVPLAGESKEQICPVGDIKVKYCSINMTERTTKRKD